MPTISQPEKGSQKPERLYVSFTRGIVRIGSADDPLVPSRSQEGHMGLKDTP